MTEPHPSCNCPMYGTSACSKYRLWHGCESHNSAKSDAVLDELESWIRSLRVQEEDIWLIERLGKKIAELRQQQKER